MSEESTEKPKREKIPFSELTLAYWVLRLWIGLRLVLAGLDKFKGSDGYTMANYTDKMGKIAGMITQNTFLPDWATKSWAMPLPFLLIAVGALILIGFLNRLALLGAGLLFVGLSFGLMLLPDEDVFMLGIHVGLVAGALALVRHNKIYITRW